MPIEVSCQSCSGRFRVPDKAAGKRIRCPKCQGTIAVPAAPAIPNESAAPQELPGAEKTVTFSAEGTTPAPAKKAPVPQPAAEATEPSIPSPAKSSAEQWHLKTEDGETYGPASRAELDAWHAEGRITAECHLLREGSDQWQWATDLYPELEAGSSPQTAAQTAPATEDEVPASAPETAASSPASDELNFNFGSPAPASTTVPKTTPSKTTATAKTPAKSQETGVDGPSDRKKLVAALLAFFLGAFGVHRFYLGYTTLGIVQLLLCGGCGIWQLIDFILILADKLPDAQGRSLQ